MKTKALISILVFVAVILCIMVLYNLLIMRTEPEIELEIAAGYSTTAEATATTAEAETASTIAAAATTEATTATAAASATAAEADEAATVTTNAVANVSDTAVDAAVATEAIEAAATTAIDETDVDGASEPVAGDDTVEELQPAPDFSMVDWDGNETKLSDLVANGKPIILNFWASWCPPCIGEMPEFDKVYFENGDDIQFVMLNMTDGQRETKEIAEKFIIDQGYSFPVYFDIDQEGASLYGIRYIPTTVFINSSGYMVAGAQSALTEDILHQGIELIK